MRQLPAILRRLRWKRMSIGAARFLAEDLAERFRTNLTAAERQELRELAVRSRDTLRELATDRERRRLGQLVSKALTGRT
jgi:hypothetical protein